MGNQLRELLFRSLSFNSLLCKSLSFSILFVGTTSALMAQETETNDKPSELPAVVQSESTNNNDDVLRLEETIRGNKEQPKVLSIVPWQLPLHQRIDRNEQRWAPIKTKLKPLERNSFLKKIKLLEGISNG
ncbi:hypothetical protein [Glaciecola sp. MF2-115]|uniref:hypothetical protein n=1 Tax=Glaciecola sp. MF2-115 TaxID=3384827 RepID=UPI0039A3CBA4